MRPEVRQHMHIVRKDMRGLRELCIAREVSCSSSGNVSVLYRISHEKGWYSCTAVLFSLRNFLFSTYCMSASKLKKCCMGRGTPNRGQLRMHDLFV